MKLSKFRVKRYKSLVDVSFDQLGSYIIVIGANGSGKSNLLEAIQLFFSEFDIDSNHKVAISSNHWHQNITRRPIEFELELALEQTEVQFLAGEKISNYIESEKRDRLLDIKASLRKDGTWKVDLMKLCDIVLIQDGVETQIEDFLVTIAPLFSVEIILAVDKAENDISTQSLFAIDKEKKLITYPPVEFQKIVDKDLLKIENQEKRRIDEIAQKRRMTVNRVNLPISELKIELPKPILDKVINHVRNSLVIVSPPNVGDVSFSRQPILEQSLVQEVLNLYENDEEFRVWHEFKKAFLQEFPGDLDVTRGQLYVVENGQRYPFHLIGSGFQSWFSFLKHFLAGDKIYIIEEPEAHLHPELIRKLSNFLKKRSQWGQLIIATHSPILVDHEDEENNWVIEKARTESKLYRVDDLRQALDTIGASPFDRMVPDKVLLVEGETDKIFLTACAEKLSIDLAKTRIVTIKGKSKLRVSLDAWDSIVAGTQIELFAMLDSDAKDSVMKLVRRGILAEDAYFVLPVEIEDLYPMHLLVDVMKSLYSIEVDQNALATPPRKPQLKEQLESNKADMKNWKIKIVERIAEKLKKKDVPKEIKRILSKLK